MSTFIASGKAMAFCVVAALASLTTVNAKDFFLDFENEKVGTMPQGLFKDTWGTLNNGIYVYTSNIMGSDKSQKSLLINALPNQDHAGLMMEFWPKGVKKGLITFEFDYMREGDGRLTFELRPGGEIWPMFRFEAETFNVYRGNWWYGKSKTDKGFLKPGIWYRLKFVMPLTPADGEKAEVSLTNLSDGSVFKEVYDEKGGWSTFPKKPEDGAVFYFLKNNLMGSVQREYIDNIRYTLKP